MHVTWVSQVALVVTNLPANAGDARDVGSIPGLGRSSGEGNGNPLKYSCPKQVLGEQTRALTVFHVLSRWGVVTGSHARQKEMLITSAS